MSCARDTLWTRTQAPSLFCPRGVKMSSGEFILPDPPREFTQIEWHSYKTIHIRLCESSQGTLGAWTLLEKVWKYVPLQWILMDFDGFWWILMDFDGFFGSRQNNFSSCCHIEYFCVEAQTQRRESRAFPSPILSVWTQQTTLSQVFSGCVKVILTLWHVCGGGWKPCLHHIHYVLSQRPISKRTKIQCL